MEGVNVTDAGILAALRGVGGYGGYGGGGSGYHNVGNFSGDGSAIRADVVANRGMNAQGQEANRDLLQSGQDSIRESITSNQMNDRFNALTGEITANARAAAECCCNVRTEVAETKAAIAQSEANVIAFISTQKTQDLRDLVSQQNTQILVGGNGNGGNGWPYATATAV